MQESDNSGPKKRKNKSHFDKVDMARFPLTCNLFHFVLVLLFVTFSNKTPKCCCKRKKENYEKNGSKRGFREEVKGKNLFSIACMNESIQYKQSIFFFERFFSTAAIYQTHISMGYNNPLSFACKLNKCLLHKKRNKFCCKLHFDISP